jgi:hypothetical protein
VTSQNTRDCDVTLRGFTRAFALEQNCILCEQALHLSGPRKYVVLYHFKVRHKCSHLTSYSYQNIQHLQNKPRKHTKLSENKRQTANAHRQQIMNYHSTHNTDLHKSSTLTQLLKSGSLVKDYYYYRPSIILIRKYAAQDALLFLTRSNGVVCALYSNYVTLYGI